MDTLLVEIWSKWGPAKAKRILGHKIQENRHGERQPRPDTVRKAVERRMSQLGLAIGTARKQSTNAKPRKWTQTELTALLGALGADASIETIAVRTGHSVKAVRAKIARLDYRVEEIHGFAVFTVDQISQRIRVTPRQIRRWKEKGWLATKNRRITEEALERFLREHPDRIPFDALAREDQIYLIDLGYPCSEQKKFRQSVREILDGIGRQRNPRRRNSQNRSDYSGMDHGVHDNHDSKEVECVGPQRRFPCPA